MANEKRLIDAYALEKDMRAYADNKAYCGHIELANGILKAVGRIDEAPTVDAVEVVHGRWLDGYAVDNNGKKVYDSIDCSVCEDIFKIESQDREYWKNRFKVCPFCGAIMDGGNEDGKRYSV